MLKPSLTDLHLFQGLPVQIQVQNLLQETISLWWECENNHYPDMPGYTDRTRLANEDLLDHFMSKLILHAGRLPKTPSEVHNVQQEISSEYSHLASAVIGLDESQLNFIKTSGLVDALVEFSQMARRFDPLISSQDIYQAGRNVMTMNLLQLLLNLPVQISPAVFAYSMLYPYSDNYLDDPSISGQTKLKFGEHFKRRLIGEMLIPANRREQTIFDLIGMVEGQFDRSLFPQVYQSLNAIQDAQLKSLKLLRANTAPYDTDALGIVFEKGGTSVLADGYLVAGSLSPSEADFMFTYGVFTQLMDDLEDVRQDMQDGIMTLFSHSARFWPLDGLTNRTFAMGQKLLSRLDCFNSPAREPIHGILQKSINPLLIVSAGGLGSYYSRSYLAELENYLPFHYSFLNKQRRKINRQKNALTRLAEILLLRAQND
ncbi:MAG: hypothetical protein P4L50_11390 [Anaerolineaceae bacterium]|nr:hypothetical protein [Anaerolineaceae bacterium]